jgi:hypothetical protein
MASCGQSSQQAGAGDTAANSALNPEPLNKDNAARAYKTYLELKDALVATDGSKAKTKAAVLVDDLGAINGYSTTAKLAKSIASTTDVKAQRDCFLMLSNDMVNLIKTAKPKNFKAYVQYCPMANDGNGGYWLSANKDVKNPYYGDDMLECGEVKEQIK